ARRGRLHRAGAPGGAAGRPARGAQDPVPGRGGLHRLGPQQPEDAGHADQHPAPGPLHRRDHRGGQGGAEGRVRLPRRAAEPAAVQGAGRGRRRARAALRRAGCRPRAQL
ncbi:unnamed protein product, partial [Heterosigma akashiwo]